MHVLSRMRVLSRMDLLVLYFIQLPMVSPHHLSYNIPVGFVKIVASHGNSKQNFPFYPTLKL
jgi:hypothetical protein